MAATGLRATIRWRSSLARATAGVALVSTVAGLALQALTQSTTVPLDFGSREAASITALVYLALPVLGMLVATRQPELKLAWVFIATGTTMALWVFADGYAVYSLLTSPGSLPGGAFAAWLANWIWIPGWALAGLLLLRFPYGRLPSPRWRPLGWMLGIGGLVFAGATMLVEGGLANYTYVDNPLGLVSADPAVVKLAGTLAMLALGLVVIASLVPRARRATGDERQQYKWVTYAATIVVGTMALGWTLFGLGIRNLLIENATLAVAGLLPIAAAIAVLKFRLYDIDVVINKTLVYGALASFVTLVYVAVVVGIGDAFGSPGERDLPLSIAATALVAVALQPAKQRVQVAVNRLVYGKRASPYEVLANFSQRMGELLGNREVLDQTAQLLGEATGAARAEVWLRSGEVVRAVACWPDGRCSTESLPLAGAEDVLAERASLSVPVRQRGELLGALTVETRPGETVRPVEVKLAIDLAGQAGHVLGNVRLTEELVRRLEDLRASRQRLVSAQDEERRRLERNLHDGAQQHLVALRVHIGLAAAAIDEGPDHVRKLLAESQQVAIEALENLRDLAHGIYPPLLAEEGLVVAVRVRFQRSPLPVQVYGDELRRYPQETEMAVYFCCLEALQNAAKYSEPPRSRCIWSTGGRPCISASRTTARASTQTR
jgi:signal transduction histidine kinase